MDKRTFKKWFWFETPDKLKKFGMAAASAVMMILTMVLLGGAFMSLVLSLAFGNPWLLLLIPVFAYLALLASRVANFLLLYEFNKYGY